MAQLHAYKAECTRWESTRAWLDQPIGSLAPLEIVDLVAECHHRLSAIPWRGQIPLLEKAFNLTSTHLAIFFADEWLDDDMINAGSEWILARCGRNSANVHIVNCLYPQQLQHAQLSGAAYAAQTSVDRLVQSRKVDILFIPLHVHGNHWALLRINLVEGTFSYDLMAKILLSHEGWDPHRAFVSRMGWFMRLSGIFLGDDQRDVRDFADN